MNLVERQRQFLDAAQKHFGTFRAVRPNKLFGVSNSAKIVEGGMQIGVVNLDSARDDAEAFIFACVMKFPPEDEVYFAVLVRNDKASLLTRLEQMKSLGAAARAAAAAPSMGSEAGDEEAEGTETAIEYSARNNLTPIYIARDGQLWLRNKGFWNSLAFDLTPFGPSTEPDQIVVALYPPTASARRSLLVREFIGWLGSLVGRHKIHELVVWDDAETLGPAMRRMPTAIKVEDIETAVQMLGGHYPNGEVKVGAALIANNGEIFTGCNVEHKYRILDVHAEVNAITNMIAAGYKSFYAIIVVAEKKNFTPCGSCLDWIIQFGTLQCLVGYQTVRDSDVDDIVKHTAHELMPYYPESFD